MRTLGAWLAYWLLEFEMPLWCWLLWIAVFVIVFSAGFWAAPALSEFAADIQAYYDR